MAKVQTRKSISINGRLFARLQQRCRQQQMSMSAYVTQLVEADLTEPPKTNGRPGPTPPPTGRHTPFTF